GKPGIAVRVDDDVDQWRSPLRFGPFGLGDASSKRDQGLGSVFAAKSADVGIGLFRGFFANVASVEDDEVSVRPVSGGGKTVRAKQFGHALAVICVHLTA